MTDYKGWIQLHRKLTDNPLWTCEKFTRGQAWVDLLLLANHCDNYFYKRGVKIDVKRGQVGISEVGLADRWKWSRSKVKKFINDLEKEQQIVQQKSNVTQIVTILNYDVYQTKEQQTVQQKSSKRAAKEQQKDTINNDNNDNNENNVNKENYKKLLLSKLSSSDVENELYLKIAKSFQELFIKQSLEVGASAKKLKDAKGTWYDDVRMLIEIDKQTKDSISKVYSFLSGKKNPSSKFWQKNIQSTKSLRNQFERLLKEATENLNK